MLRGVTLRPPVSFVAITTSSRFTDPFRSLSHRPMHSSVDPSGQPPPLGIGYCSAVSRRLTPDLRMASSIKSKHSFSSGALWSSDTQRCVPSPSSDTTISPDPPSRRCFMPLTTLTTSLVGPFGLLLPPPGEEGDVGTTAAAAAAAPPLPPLPKMPPNSPAPRTVRREGPLSLALARDDVVLQLLCAVGCLVWKALAVRTLMAATSSRGTAAAAAAMRRVRVFVMTIE
mmetsp:Transcript_20823/g.49204  ORF Transcript_20823/g.49204 Transcript_20823/m.49204 type:complete len:228 (+) Transcript_20823:966-1649(+)